MLETFYSFNRGEYPFQLFSFSHVTMLLITIGILSLLFFFREKIRKRYKQSLRYILLITLILSEVFFHLWYIIHDRWDITINLPLQLCSISLYLCAIMLLTRSYIIFEISFFVSMSGAFLAMVTPELFFGYPHMRFFQFFIAHMVIIIVCFYMVWIERFRPTFISIFKAFFTLNIIAIFVFIINKLIGSNYMFLSKKPSNASLIDLLGPYPWYIVSLEAVAFILFTIVYVVLFLGRKTRKRV